jgi:hypothetical protein
MPKIGDRGVVTDYDVQVQAELEIVDTEYPCPVVPWAEQERLYKADPSLKAAMEDPYKGCACWGKQCQEAMPCPGCQVRRRYLALLLHREKYGKPLHPSDRAMARLPRSLLPGAAATPKPRSTPETAADPGSSFGTEYCNNWSVCRGAWVDALKWRQDLDDVLSVMLAVVASTSQAGQDQLFLWLIGDAGSAKTRLCTGLLTSRRCYAVEHLTGFYSGWQGQGEDKGEDFSILARANHCTWVTPEGDVLVSNPRFQELMSQGRRIFDGEIATDYKTRRDQKQFKGLRTPWIIAGTPAMLDHNQSRVGDRFMKVFIDKPGEEDEDDILMRAGYASVRSTLMTSNGDMRSTVDPPMLRAYRLTGGYVDWLRANAAYALAEVEQRTDIRRLLSDCAMTARMTAFLRARPADSRRVEAHDTKELPTRLVSQYARLALCLAVATNRTTVDQGVMRRLAKVAVDTSAGQTRDLCAAMHRAGNQGMELETLAAACGVGGTRARQLLVFLAGLGAVEHFKWKAQAGVSPRTRWRLTGAVRDTWNLVVDSGNGEQDA